MHTQILRNSYATYSVFSRMLCVRSLWPSYRWLDTCRAHHTHSIRIYICSLFYDTCIIQTYSQTVCETTKCCASREWPKSKRLGCGGWLQQNFRHEVTFYIPSQQHQQQQFSKSTGRTNRAHQSPSCQFCSYHNSVCLHSPVSCHHSNSFLFVSIL